MQLMVDALREADEFGRSPLHYAAADGNTAEVARLLADGAEVGPSDAASFTPLHFAAQEQHPQVIALLVAAGADLRATDRWGNTPLWRAVFTAHGNREAAGALIAAGADPDLANLTGVSPRRLAQRMGLGDLPTTTADMAPVPAPITTSIPAARTNQTD